MKELCEGLTALHDALPHNQPDQMAVHPVVRVHPETGRKALYVNEHFTRRIVEMNATESDAIADVPDTLGAKPAIHRPLSLAGREPSHSGIIVVPQHFVLNDFEGERVIATGDS
ncbi:MAG: TauD/TfdA family dioxygenase [Gammaproteobacteria bacterium]|nr:TauD/TfdA family dioxygenase [Gammaproteobacteria bacterium]